MRIVHINTVDSGGAFNAAYRLYQSQRSSGMDSYFLCLHNNNSRKDITYYDANIDYPFTRKILWKFGIPYTKEHDQILINKKLPEEVEKYSIAETDYDISKLKLIQDADILHFHWVSGFVNLNSTTLIKKKIIWTLHDLNPLIGGFHYKLDERKHKSFLTESENRIKVIKCNFFLNHQISFVSPSKWLFNYCIVDDRITKDRIHLIPYGIDTSVFTCFKHIAISERKKILLIADNNNSIRKGSEFVERLFHDFSNKIDFIVVGSSNFCFDIKQYGFIESIDTLVQIYNSADFVLILSIEDNLPNIILESLSCGTPILGFPVGGLIDHIHGNNGILADEVSYNSINKIITHIIENDPLFDRDKIRDYALRNFDMRLQFQSYKNLYEQVLKE
ncbi:MAG TPA: hypothetical protein DDX98_08410 [Bacteroidales bacterium]|nr:hypothetical protein [Bacteroidales bacterium]